MTWSHPELLWLLPVLAALASVRWWWGRRILRQRAGVGAGISNLTASVARRRGAVRGVLFWSGLAVGLAALAGPRWGASDELSRSSGADVLLVLDCSRSMLATDLYPTRIAAAKRKCLDLLRLAPETRIALMPFAAVPVLRCPLTGDHSALELMLQDCGPELFPAESGYQGTAIGDAVQAGLKVLGKQVERGQAILVMSDGADDDKAAVEGAAKAARTAGVPVYGIFFGDSERKVTLSIDGKDETMDADRSTLDQLATITGGACVNAGNDDRDVRLVHDHLQQHVVQLPWEERRRMVMSERYLWLLLPAMGLIALADLIPTGRKVRRMPT